MWSAALGDSYTNLVEKLIAKGADVNARDAYGVTALRKVKGTSSAAIEKLLEDAGAKE
jgi:ankyrin repeat protein